MRRHAFNLGASILHAHTQLSYTNAPVNSLVFAFLIYSPLLFLSTGADFINITIDDQGGDTLTGFIPTYLPHNGTWNVGSPSEVCSCDITPSVLDLSKIHNHTWHDATHLPGQAPTEVIVNFTGSAVYVFAIVPNSLPDGTITFADIVFTLDGTSSGSFVHSPNTGTDTILYNQSIYSLVGLEHGPHTLVMTLASDTVSLFLFDYVVYTTERNDSSTSTTSTVSTSIAPIPFSPSTTQVSSPPSPQKHVGAIIGGVLGGVAFIVLSGLITFFLLGKKKVRLRVRREHHKPIAGITYHREASPSTRHGFYNGTTQYTDGDYA